MNILSFVLLQCNMGGGTGGGTGTGGGSQSPWTMIVMFALIAVVFYLFFIRPQSKRNKEMKKFRENLKRGDKIVTAGGIHGKILEVAETWVIIETEGLGKLKIEKASIASSTTGEQQTS
jgi:preprotein translocase subunit YajC